MDGPDQSASLPGLLTTTLQGSVTAAVVTWAAAFLAALAHGALQNYLSRRLVDGVSPQRRERLERYLEREDLIEAALRLLWIVAEVLFFLLLPGLLSATSSAGNPVFGAPDSAARVLWALCLGLLVVLPSLHALPRAFAGRGFAEPILRASLRPLYYLSLLLYPVTKPLMLIPAGRKLFASEEHAGNGIEQDLATEEIIDAVEEGERAGALQEPEAHMIERVLSFRDLSVSEVMTPRTDLTSIAIQASIAEACNLAHREGHSKIPVYEKNRDEIAGIFHLRDAIPLLANGRGVPELKEVMREAYFVPETKKATQLLQEFQNNEQSIAIVLDEYGGTAGLITVEDILEEIVGEIREEHDQEDTEPIQRLGPDLVSVDPRLRIEEVNEELDIRLPESEDYDTIGGFVFSHLDRIPESGEVFTFEELEFRVLRVDNRRIARLQLRMAVP